MGPKEKINPDYVPVFQWSSQLCHPCFLASQDSEKLMKSFTQFLLGFVLASEIATKLIAPT